MEPRPLAHTLAQHRFSPSPHYSTPVRIALRVDSQHLLHTRRNVDSYIYMLHSYTQVCNALTYGAPQWSLNAEKNKIK